MANGALRFNRSQHLDERRLKGALGLTNRMREWQLLAQQELGGYEDAVAVRWLNLPDCDPVLGPGYYALENGSDAVLLGHNKEQADRSLRF